MRIWISAFLAWASSIVWLTYAFADYTILLKNGRQIIVQSYREEGSVIKIFGLGGELGIPKDQIQAISKGRQSGHPGLNILDMETSSRQSRVPEESVPPPTRDIKDAVSPSEQEIMTGAEEQEEYQKRLAEVTQKLQAAQGKFFNAIQGGGTAYNVSREGIQAWVMDFASRIHDSQKIPGGGGPNSTPPTPPYAPTFTAKEKELSGLRTEIDALQKERNALIEEMNRKNIPTGTL